MHRGRLDGLDGLRGIAALCVFLSHVFPEHPTSAYLAVDFFFMLSGYVMARSSEASFAAGGGAGRRFMAARIRRLLPTIFLSGLFALPWLLTQPEGGAAFVIVCLAVPWVINFPAWSIGAELFANLAHACAFARLPLRALLVFSGVAGVVLVVIAWNHGLDFVPGRAAWWAVGLRALVPYGIGIALYRLWRDRPSLAPGAAFTWLAMPAFVALATLFPSTRGGADLVFMLLLCPLLIAGGLRHGQGSRLARWSGELSFPLYAAHAPALLGLQALGFDDAWRLPGGLAAGVLVLAATRLAARRRTPSPTLPALEAARST